MGLTFAKSKVCATHHQSLFELKRKSELKRWEWFVELYQLPRNYATNVVLRLILELFVGDMFKSMPSSINGGLPQIIYDGVHRWIQTSNLGCPIPLHDYFVSHGIDFFFS